MTTTKAQTKNILEISTELSHKLMGLFHKV